MPNPPAESCGCACCRIKVIEDLDVPLTARRRDAKVCKSFLRASIGLNSIPITCSVKKKMVS